MDLDLGTMCPRSDLDPGVVDPDPIREWFRRAIGVPCRLVRQAEGARKARAVGPSAAAAKLSAGDSAAAAPLPSAACTLSCKSSLGEEQGAHRTDQSMETFNTACHGRMTVIAHADLGPFQCFGNFFSTFNMCFRDSLKQLSDSPLKPNATIGLHKYF